MYEEIGGKIKIVAKIIGFLGIGISAIAGSYIMFLSIFEKGLTYFGIGMFVFLAGSLISWASTITLYGFGQLIENTDILVQQCNDRKSKETSFKDTSKNSLQ